MGSKPTISSVETQNFAMMGSILDIQNNKMPDQPSSRKKQVALYVTCLVNSLRPDVGFACIKLIESLGFSVDVPPLQTCCGQPAFNGGQRAQAREVAKSQIKALQHYEHVVIPSGSCAGMMIIHYPELFADDPGWLARAESLAARCMEFSQFLEHHQWQPVKTRLSGNNSTWAYHTSCSCRRETRSHEDGRALLTKAGINLAPLKGQEVCCGFGGSFAAKFNALSARMGQNKLADVAQCGANGVTSADLGCLLHLESLSKTSALEFRHIAEVLADHAALNTDDL